MRRRRVRLDGKVLLVPVHNQFVVAVVGWHMFRDGLVVVHLLRGWVTDTTSVLLESINATRTFLCGIYWDNVELGGCIDTGITIEHSKLREEWSTPEFGIFNSSGEKYQALVRVLSEPYLSGNRQPASPRQASLLDRDSITGLNEAAIESFLEGKIHRHQDRQRKGARPYL